MLEPLSIKEAVDGVINLQNLDEFATAVFPPVPNPIPGDDAQIYVGVPPELVGSIELDPEVEGVLQIPKNVLLKYSGNRDIPFYYEVYRGGGGNSDDSEKAFYKIVLAVK